MPLRFLGGVHRLVLAGRRPSSRRAFRRSVATATRPPRGRRCSPHSTPTPTRSATRSPGRRRRTRWAGRRRSSAASSSWHGTRASRSASSRSARARGLNLRFDRYWYESDGAGYGDPVSPVRFTDLWEEGRPPFDASVKVAERRGCDRDPIDAGTEDGRLTLLSYVWPGQTQRFTMLRAALDVARDVPIRIDRADIPAWLARQLDEPAPGRATVVFHSIIWQYLTDDERATAEAALAAAGRPRDARTRRWLGFGSNRRPTSRTPTCALPAGPAARSSSSRTATTTSGRCAGLPDRGRQSQPLRRKAR